MSQVTIHIPVGDLVDELLMFAASEDFAARKTMIKRYDFLQWVAQFDRRFEEFFSLCFNLVRSEARMWEEQVKRDAAYNDLSREYRKKKYLRAFNDAPKVGTSYVFVVPIEGSRGASRIVTPDEATEQQRSQWLPYIVRVPDAEVDLSTLTVNDDRYAVKLDDDTATLVERLYQEDIAKSDDAKRIKGSEGSPMFASAWAVPYITALRRAGNQ